MIVEITHRNIYDAPLMVDEEDWESTNIEAHQKNESFGFNASVEYDDGDLAQLLRDDITFYYVDVLPTNNTVIDEYFSEEDRDSNTDEE